jgi:hypothetical protein
MYMDEKLIFARATDTPAVNTKAVSLLQGDHPGWPDSNGRTDGSAPYQGLYLFIRTGEDIAASGAAATFTAKLQHGDAEAGPFTDLLVLPTVTVADGDTLPAGTVIGVAAIPHGAKNWLRVNLSAARAVDAFLTNAADKHYPGVWDGSDN